jgi:hypothetical protein
MLCDKCSNIHFKRIEDCEVIRLEPERLREDSSYSYSEGVFYFHHKDKEALKRSANQGCHFCEMLRRSLFGEGSAYSCPLYHFARGEVILRRSIVERWIKKEFGLDEWNRCDWVYVQCGKRNATTTSVLEYVGE